MRFSQLSSLILLWISCPSVQGNQRLPPPVQVSSSSHGTFDTPFLVLSEPASTDNDFSIDSQLDRFANGQVVQADLDEMVDGGSLAGPCIAPTTACTATKKHAKQVFATGGGRVGVVLDALQSVLVVSLLCVTATHPPGPAHQKSITTTMDVDDVSALKSRSAAKWLKQRKQANHLFPGNSEFSAPAFLQAGTGVNKAFRLDSMKPVNLSGIADISKAYAHPSKPSDEDSGERRAQEDSVCDAERSNFWGCVPAGQCTDCFNTAFEEAIEVGISCVELESRLCAIPTTCGCGCETEGEIFYDCLVSDITDCPGIECSVEPVCETELEAASSCLINSGNSVCAGCLSTVIDELFAESETVSCFIFESEACTAIYDTCGCEGCTEEVDTWYDCLFSDDCGGIQCDTPISAPVAATPTASPVSVPTTSVETPFPTASEPCFVCGMESMMVESGLTTIFNGEEYACEDLQDWGTQRLFDVTTCQLTTLLVTKDCNCSPSTAPVGSPAASPTATEETSFPTYTEICYVCNDPDLTVTPGLTTIIDDTEYSCELVEEFGLDRLAGGSFCQLLTLLVPKDCNCVPIGGGVETAPPSSAPTYSEPCYVCGDPESRVDPDLMVTIGEIERSCQDVQIIFESTQVASPSECNILSGLVADSCDCQSPETTSMPAAAPTTDSPTKAPMAPVVISPTTSPPPPSPPTAGGLPTEAPVGSAVAKSSEGGGGGGALYALAALALVPIVAGLFFYCKSKKPDAPKNQKPTGNDVVLESELNDTVPGSPQRAYNPQAAGAPAPHHHHHGDASATASMRSEDDRIHHPPPVAAVAVHSSGGGWSASDSIPSYDDPARRSVGEVSSGSGQSHDPPATPVGVAARNTPAPYAAQRNSARSSGSYMPDVKDQCRPVANEPDIVVDEVVAIDSDDHRKPAPIDP